MITEARLRAAGDKAAQEIKEHRNKFLQLRGSRVSGGTGMQLTIVQLFNNYLLGPVWGIVGTGNTEKCVPLVSGR